MTMSREERTRLQAVERAADKNADELANVVPAVARLTDQLVALRARVDALDPPVDGGAHGRR